MKKQQQKDWQSLLKVLTVFNYENYLFCKTFPVACEVDVNVNGERQFNAFLSTCAKISLRFDAVKGVDGWSAQDIRDLAYLVIEAYGCFKHLLNPKPFIRAHFAKVEEMCTLFYKMGLAC